MKTYLFIGNAYKRSIIDGLRQECITVVTGIDKRHVSGSFMV